MELLSGGQGQEGRGWIGDFWKDQPQFGLGSPDISKLFHKFPYGRNLRLPGIAIPESPYRNRHAASPCCIAGHAGVGLMGDALAGLGSFVEVQCGFYVFDVHIQNAAC